MLFIDFVISYFQFNLLKLYNSYTAIATHPLVFIIPHYSLHLFSLNESRKFCVEILRDSLFT